jgi:hypothetical protein
MRRMRHIAFFCLLTGFYNIGFANSRQCIDLFRLTYLEDARLENLYQENERLLEELLVSTNQRQRQDLTNKIHKNDLKMTKHSHRTHPQWPRPLTLVKIYIGERDWATQSIQLQKVTYLNREQRESLKVEMTSDGLRSMATGELITKDIHGIFVISTKGEIYLQWETPEGVHTFRHSSFFAGTPVLFAGYLQMTANGQVKLISNKSGHYEPSKLRLDWAIRFLEERGFDFSKARIDDIAGNDPLGRFWHIFTGEF